MITLARRIGRSAAYPYAVACLPGITLLAIAVGTV